MKKEPEQGTHNTISLKCFLCQGNWTGTNKEELREHLEQDHKVVFQINELIELSKPEELEPATTLGEEERLLVVTETRINTTSGEKISQYFIVGNYDYFSGQPEELDPTIITDDDEQILTVTETNSGERKGQPEELELRHNVEYMGADHIDSRIL